MSPLRFVAFNNILMYVVFSSICQYLYTHMIQIAPTTMTTGITMAPCPPLSAATAVSHGTVSPLIHTATSQVTSWSGTIVAIHRRILARRGVIPWMRTPSGNIAPENPGVRPVYFSVSSHQKFIKSIGQVLVVLMNEIAIAGHDSYPEGLHLVFKS